MAITNTTLKIAATGYATTLVVASTANITAPVVSTATGKTLLYIDNELIGVVGVPAIGMVTVERGIGGSQALPHVVNSIVLIGGPNDFPQFSPKVGSFVVAQDRYQGVSSAVAAATTIAAPGTFFHVTGTTATSIITPPANFVEGSITIIPDGAWSWGTSASAGGIAVAGAAAAGSTVTFIYDAVTALWYPEAASGSPTVSSPVAAAAVLAASGTLFHVTGTTATTTITPPTNFNAQAITIIADAAWTWTSTTSANGIAQTGAVTSAGEAVQFVYDPATALWYPNRRA